MNPFLKDPNDGEAREDLREQRLRTLGSRTPHCSVPGCEENDPLALTGAAPNIVCKEHLAQANGVSRVEDHHAAGRHNDPVTVPLPANDHSAASAHQQLWPEETLRNPSGSPLRRAAAWIRGWVDVLRVMIDRGIGRIPAALERLDVLLSQWIGPDWWETVGWSW